MRLTPFVRENLFGMLECIEKVKPDITAAQDEPGYESTVSVGPEFWSGDVMVDSVGPGVANVCVIDTFGPQDEQWAVSAMVGPDRCTSIEICTMRGQDYSGSMYGGKNIYIGAMNR